MKNSFIYQTGTINSLIQAVYEGDVTIGDLKVCGDFGLGTFDLVDGELIACDNCYYRADVEGNLTIIDDAAKTPFSVVNHFCPSHALAIKNLNFEALEQLLLQNFPSKNFMYAIKVKATFSTIDLRSEQCQARPFRPLAETMPGLQHAFSKQDSAGTLVGYWFPDYLRQVNVPGFHFHFIDDQRQCGGHVFNFSLTTGVAEIQVIKSLRFDAIDSEAFRQADLATEAAAAISQLEQKR